MSDTIEDAEPEEIVSALVEVSKSAEEDFKTFCRGFQAALATYTDYEPEDCDGDMVETVKVCYYHHLNRNVEEDGYIPISEDDLE